jgi:hypothetical protein
VSRRACGDPCAWEASGVQTLWFLAGLAVVSFALLDAVATTLSTTTRAGPMTRVTTVATWRVALALHERRRIHRLLTVIGPGLLVAGLVQWLLLIWVGWTMVFASSDAAVLLAEGPRPAGPLDTFYFAGVSLFSLGTGDVVATTSAWRAMSVVATATGLFVLTLSLSYFISVVGAATERRVLATRLGALGDSPQEIVLNSWDGQRFSADLGDVLAGLAEPVARLAEQHVTYHVLHYFHARESSRSVVVGLARLDEALRLLDHAVDPEARPSPLLTRQMRDHLTRVLEVVGRVHRTIAREERPPAPDTSRMERAGIPLAEPRKLAVALDHDADRRRDMAALVDSDGWRWDDVSGHERDTAG